MGSGPSFPHDYENLARPYTETKFIKEKKGVAIDTRTNKPVSCLFCRISEESHTEDRTIWYRDDYVSVFVPLGPAAPFHFLIVPRQHYPPATELTATDVGLLEHMKKVGQMMLESHLPQRETVAPFKPCQKPPTYEYPRGSSYYNASPAVRFQNDSSISVVVDSAQIGLSQLSHTPLLSIATDASAPIVSSVPTMPLSKADRSLDPWTARFVFHVPPFNSIHHLHLHVLAGPPPSLFHRLKYSTNRVCVWTRKWDQIVLNLWRKSK